MCQLGRSYSFDSEQTNKKKVCRFVQQPNRRTEKEIKCAEWPRQRESNGEGIPNCNVLRRQLAEDDMEKGDSDESERDRNGGNHSARVNAAERKKRLQHFSEILFAHVAQRQAGKSHAEL